MTFLQENLNLFYDSWKKIQPLPYPSKISALEPRISILVVFPNNGRLLRRRDRQPPESANLGVVLFFPSTSLRHFLLSKRG